MSDPADKSDDLIAELAKLMAAPAAGGGSASAAPVARSATPEPTPAPATPAQPSAPPVSIRIPGMDAPAPVAPPVAAPVARPAPAQPTAQAASPTASRAPVTGSIRIPGMDQPAPVSPGAPVPKFNFGEPMQSPSPIQQEPLSTLTERLAAVQNSPIVQNGTTPRTEPTFGNPPSAAPRVPSENRPVSENRSFVAPPAAQPAPPVAPAGPTQAAAPSTPTPDFDFDFGFGAAPKSPESKAPESKAPEARPAADLDPIADLIAAELVEDIESSAPRAPAPQPAAPPKPIMAPLAATPVAPVIKPLDSTPPPLKPVTVAPRAPESDRFSSAPAAGLNMKAPQPSQPLNTPTPPRTPEPVRSSVVDTDPMAEIESLIGEAVRVELSAASPVRVHATQEKVAPSVKLESADDLEHEIAAPPAKPVPTQPPAVPPLTTHFAPRRSGLSDEPGRSSAEDAILAAAAATGAAVDRIEPDIADEHTYRRLKTKPAASPMRQYVGMAVAGTLLLAAGFGLYWVLNMGGGNAESTAASAPVLTADVTPTKEVPVAAPAAETDVARSPVLDQMGGTAVDTSAEQLVSTDQTATTPVTRDVTDVAAADTEGGLANRKVRTVTVRPDGTIVSGDDAVAGAEELPIDRPNVPEVPASTETTDLLGDSTAVAATAPVTGITAPATLSPVETTATDLTETAAVQPVFNPNLVAPRPISFPVRSTSTTAFAPAPEPAAPAASATISGAQTPNGQIDLLGGNTQVATAAPAPSTGSAAAYVQLSSSPSRADAESSVRALNNRYGSLFGGNQLEIQTANLGQKGTWYRVKLPAPTLASAQSMCSSIKANGGDCIVTD